MLRTSIECVVFAKVMFVLNAFEAHEKLTIERFVYMMFKQLKFPLFYSLRLFGSGLNRARTKMVMAMEAQSLG
jgi:hypothetical protein